MKVYECPEWCIHKEADHEIADGVDYGPRHEEYAANLDDTLPDPSAPEHQSERVSIFDVRTHDSAHSQVQIDVQFSQVHGQPIELYVGVDGDGLEIETEMSRTGTRVADELERAAAYLRGFLTKHEDVLTS